MSASSGFFGQRNAQAVLKHGVLARYAHYFAGRAGSVTGRVAFIDGYAGEGRYDDGSPGSPLLLASRATRVKMFGRDVKLAFVEQDDARRAQLAASLDDAGVEVDQLLAASLESVVDDLLDRYSDHAVLLFVDPFGLAISRQTLERVLRRRSHRQPIDCLYHFSLSAVARMGRAGVLPGPTSDANAALLDRALGPIGWREDFRAATGAAAPTHAALAVARRFGTEVGASVGMPSTSIPVRQRPGQLPKYALMLFSHDARAHWDFADQAAKAHVDWLHHCDRADYEANLRLNEEHGVLELFATPEPDVREIDERIRIEALEVLPDRILRIIGANGGVRPVESIEEIYGPLLGRSRSTHVREVLKGLHRQGLISDPGTGDFWHRTIR